MDKSLNTVPVANRIHIGVFGRMNAGKSSLINALTGQQVSIVSAQAGTTTDVVKKPMEIHGLGPCVLLDTAGFDDDSQLGLQRIRATKKACEGTDIALVLLGDREGGQEEKGDPSQEFAPEREWILRFQKSSVPVLVLLTKADLRPVWESQALIARAGKALEGIPLIHPPILVSANTGEGIDELKKALVQTARELPEKKKILGDLVKEGDTILMVMPQDPEAPQGRLILPQVQTIREALDRRCLCLCVQPDQMEGALSKLKEAPELIVTDSQCFDLVYQKKPKESRLTSFSILFAAYKGDLEYYYQSAQAIANLTERSRVLIAECCTHAPIEEDIGRVKIPALLRKRVGQGLTVDVCSGQDFPADIQSYDLIIQCGGCMLGRRQVLSRIEKAKEAIVPMTNYGICIAYLKKILEKVQLPE